MRFPGQYYDVETGEHYNWNRTYMSGIGRYSQVDPIGFAAGDINIYRYVANTPNNAADPYGLYLDISVGVNQNDRTQPGAIEIRIKPWTLKEQFKYWYKMNKDISWTKDLPNCPSKIKICNGNPLDCNNGQWYGLTSDAMVEKYHKGAKWCMRSKMTSKGSAQQCCYDRKGTLLKSGLGAGTPDLDSSNWKNFFLKHWGNDVRPFDIAWTLDKGSFGKYLKMYLEVRPPNQGGGKCYK